MLLDIIRAAVQVTQTLGQVCGDQLRKEVNGIGVQVWRILDFSAEDVLVDLDRRAAVPERRKPAQHFENQNTQRPPSSSQQKSYRTESPC